MTSTTTKQTGWHLTWLLVKNRLLAQTGLNVFRYEQDSKKKRNKLIMLTSIVIIMVVLIFYLTATAVGYALMGLNELTPGIALVMSSLITLFFTMFKANGELFGFKDYELVMSLPFPTRTIINSRFLNMYIWNTLFSLSIMLPMGAVYAWFAKPSLLFYPMWLLGIGLVSLIPTTLAAVFGAVITAISTKFRYANVVVTLLSFMLVIGITVGSLSLGTSDSLLKGTLDNSKLLTKSLSALAPILSDSINQLYPPARLFTEGVVEGKLGSFLLFALLSFAWYVVFVYILSLRYQQINTAITSHRSRADYQMVRLRQGGMLGALYKKTILRILKSTVAATNLLMGCIMAILAIVALVVVGPEKMVQGMGSFDIMPIFKGAAPFVIAAIASMTNTACVSLALEGKTIWLIKSLPIAPKTLYDSYLLVNLTFTIPTSLICSLLMSLAIKFTFGELLLLFVVPVIFVSAAAVFGLAIGNRLAYYDWQEEVQLIKQSMMSMLGTLCGLVFIGLCGVIVNSGLLPVNSGVLTVIVSGMMVILTIALYRNESRRPIKE